MVEIKLPFHHQSHADLSRINTSPLALKVGQLIDVKVLQSHPDTQSITLSFADKTFQVLSNQPVALKNGDELTLEVLGVKPSPEFKLVASAPVSLRQVSSASSGSLQVENIILKVPRPSADIKGPGHLSLSAQPDLNLRQPITAKVVAVLEQQVRLQLSPESIGPKANPLIDLALDRATAMSLKPGQTVVLEPARPGLAPTYKESNSPVKIIEIIRKYLPIHESPLSLIDHLLKNASALQQNERVSDTLKRLAMEILQNLPKQQQLTQSTFLKQAVAQSGLFLEANLVSSQEASSPLPSNDLKAHLLKLAEGLKPETNPQGKAETTTADLEQLKILLQKTESSIAKITLDQLASVAKEDGTQQLWQVEVPFLNKDKADSVKIEIERDQRHKDSSDSQSWSVTITLTPPNLGTLHCKVTFLDGTINTHFWSGQASITRLIEQNLDALKRQLENSGLKTGHLEALEGEPARQKFQGNSGQKLVDESV